MQISASLNQPKAAGALSARESIAARACVAIPRRRAERHAVGAPVAVTAGVSSALPPAPPVPVAYDALGSEGNSDADVFEVPEVHVGLVFALGRASPKPPTPASA